MHNSFTRTRVVEFSPRESFSDMNRTEFEKINVGTENNTLLHKGYVEYRLNEWIDWRKKKWTDNSLLSSARSFAGKTRLQMCCSRFSREKHTHTLQSADKQSKSDENKKSQTKWEIAFFPTQHSVFSIAEEEHESHRVFIFFFSALLLMARWLRGGWEESEVRRAYASSHIDYITNADVMSASIDFEVSDWGSKSSATICSSIWPGSRFPSTK